MRILVIGGLGPSIKNSSQLMGTFLGAGKNDNVPYFHKGLGRNLSPESFFFNQGSEQFPVLRSRKNQMQNLTSSTLATIIENGGWEYEIFPLEELWTEVNEPHFQPTVVALSTTFICNMSTLKYAVEWIDSRFPDAILVVGGQYSNLKYMNIMREIQRVDYIIRGDGEIALPAFIRAISREIDMADVPNLVLRDLYSQNVVSNGFSYTDIDGYTPRFKGKHDVIPYESMRGCPFSCKFCSFPAASPKWRYKSTKKILDDWSIYRDENETRLIKAMDSTFTVPLSRFRTLLSELPDLNIGWEAYTRANIIKNKEVVEALEAANCKILSIGFESMSNNSLQYMHKQVTAEENHQAHDFLIDSEVGFRCSFMVGYPGETPQDYELTHRFIVDRMSTRFLLSTFSLMDETMPVWNDAELYHIEVEDPQNPDSSWQHVGMDSITARDLYNRTLREARWKNENGNLLLWQMKYQMPLIPNLSDRRNRRIEKLIERLAYAPLDFEHDQKQVVRISKSIDHELHSYGVNIL